MRAGLRLLEEHELKLKELRAMIDEGDRDLAHGRTTRLTNPKAYAAAKKGRA